MKHHLLRRLGALILALALAFPLAVTPAWAADEADIKVTKITLSDEKFDLSIGSKRTLTVTEILPLDAVERGYEWSSEDEAIATVDENGVVTGVSGGTVKIFATAIDGSKVSAFCEVTVIDRNTATRVEITDPNGNRVENTTVTVEKDKETTLTAGIFAGTLAVRRNVTWSVSPANTDVIQLTPGENGTVKIEAKNPGIVDLVATWETDTTKTATCKISVPTPGETAVTKIELNKTTLTLGLNRSEKLMATVIPSYATHQEVEWSSSNPAVASVTKDGVVTGEGMNENDTTGTAIITAKATDNSGVTATCTVTVVRQASGITVSPSTFRINPNRDAKTATIRATLTPNTSVDPVTWESSDTSVVTVERKTTTSSDEGGNRNTLTFQGPGMATVTASTGNYKAECVVTVSGIVLEKTSLSMVEGGTSTLLLAGRYGDASGTATPEWKTSDPGGLSIRASEGSATLTAYTKGSYTVTVSVGNFSANCTVNVVEDTSAIIQGGTVRVGNSLLISTLSSQLNSICYSKTGAGLSYINNLSVPTVQGILHNNHRSEADTGAGVGASDKFYPSKTTGEEALSALSFVPRNTYNGVAEITFTGWGTNNQSFNGIIRVTVAGLGEGSDVSYSANGAPVTFQSSDFNTVSNARTGHNLKYVTFTLPSASQGTLYYNYTSDSHPGEKVLSTTQYKRSGTPNLDKVTFVPTAGYSGTVMFSYRAVDTSDMVYTGIVTITVNGQYNPSEPGDLYYNTVHGSWVTFRSYDFEYASYRAIGESLAYVRFTLPPSSAGTLFYNYWGFSNNGGMVEAATSYYQSGSPSLSSVSFVPSTTAPGQVEIAYTGYGVRGDTFTGTIHVTVGAGSTATQPGIGDITNPGWGFSFYFSDMNSFSWAASAVDYLYERGVVYGTGGTSFSPGQNVLRRDFVVMLCRAFKFTSTSTQSFSDVPADTYYSQPIAAARERNIVSGSNNRFYPNSQLTRQDAMVMIYNSLQSSGQAIGNVHTSILNDFRDVGSVSGYAKEAVATLVKMGVINGDHNKRLNPGSTITRAEVAAILYRVMTYTIRG